MRPPFLAPYLSINKGVGKYSFPQGDHQTVFGILGGLLYQYARKVIGAGVSQKTKVLISNGTHL